MCVCSVTQSYPTLCDPKDYSLPGSSVHWIFQAIMLEWIAISSSRDLPDPGIKPESPVSPALQADSLPLSHLGSPYYYSTTTVPILWMRTLRLERLSDEPRSQTREQRGCDLNPRTQARVHSLNTAFRAFSYSLSSLLNKSKTCQEDMLTPFCRRENEFL